MLMRMAMLIVACLAHGVAVAQAPADSVATGETKNYLVPVPVIYYSPETKLAFGLSGAWIYRTDRTRPESRTSNIGGIGIYTTRNQLMLAFGFDHNFDQDRQQLLGGIAYQKFPNDFYGIGNDTPVEDPEDYTDEGSALTIDYLRQLRGAWRGGGGILLGTSSITGAAPGTLLDSGEVHGSDGGQVVGAGLVLAYDSRDRTGYPVRGGYHQFSWRTHAEVLGADYRFDEARVDLRRYLPFGASRVLALRALGIATGGTVPFQMLPALGGDQLLRGYYAARFRERQLVAIEGEYRSRLWKRLGFAAFAGAGQVAHDLDGLALGRFRASGGVGLRFLLIAQEGMNLRADFGFGEDQSAFYIGFGEAF